MGKSFRTRGGDTVRAGLLIINGDDWGGDPQTTDRILECSMRGALSSVSAMVFMEDSVRAAALAEEHRIEAGLHLNLTSPFSASCCPARLQCHLQQIARHLQRHRFARVIFHPGLVDSFRYVVEAQFEEFRRIYGKEPTKLDGHHHMHLCANVLKQKLIPSGMMVRRNFSFNRGEKGSLNRLYRGAIDASLARRHRLTDCFFSLDPLEPSGRLRRIYSLARNSVVELATHPVHPDEYRYLAGGEILRELGDIQIARSSAALRF